MSDEIKFLYLKSHPVFSNLSDAKIKEACKLAKTKTVNLGESFGFGEGNFSKIFLLINGKVKITESDEKGNELIKEILTSPDLFGNLSLEIPKSSDDYAEPLTKTTIICHFNITDFKKLLQENPAMAINYANAVQVKLKKLEGRHSDLVFRDAKSRLVRFLKNWAHTEGYPVGDKIILTNYLTHKDIANIISTSRQNVNVLLNELRDSGILYYNRRQIELPNTVLRN